MATFVVPLGVDVLVIRRIVDGVCDVINVVLDRKAEASFVMKPYNKQSSNVASASFRWKKNYYDGNGSFMKKRMSKARRKVDSGVISESDVGRR